MRARLTLVWFCLALIGGAFQQRARAVAGTVSGAATHLTELRKTFTIRGKPVPPEVFRDFGDGDLADSGSIIVAIDINAAIDSNLYADAIGHNGAWVSQTKQAQGETQREVSAYRFLGVLPNGFLAAVTSYNGGGSGTFYSLHVVDAVIARAFDDEGKLYERVNLSPVRTVALGDRWSGDAEIRGDKIIVTTEREGPVDDSGKTTRREFAVDRP